MGALALPESYGFRSFAGVPGRALAYIYSLAAVVLIGRLLTRGREQAVKVLPLLFIFVLFVTVYALSWYRVPRAGEPMDLARFHYFSPAHLVIIPLLAVAISRTRHAGWCLAVFIALGIAGQATMLFNETPGRALRYRGYSYFPLGLVWQERLYPRSELFTEAAPRLAALTPAERRAVVWGMFDRGWPDPVATAGRIAEIDPAYRIYFAEAVGSQVGGRGAGSADEIAAATQAMSDEERAHFYLGYSGVRLWSREGRAAHVRSVATVDPRYRPWFNMSLGTFMSVTCRDAEYVGECGESSSLARGLPPEEQAWVYRGAGAVEARRWVRTLALDERHVGPYPVPDERRDDFAWGIGWGLRQVFKEDRVRTLDWIARLTPAVQAVAQAGARACEAWYRLDDGPRQ